MNYLLLALTFLAGMFSAVTCVILAFLRRWDAIKRIVLFYGGWLGFYFALLIGFSFASRPKTLSLNDDKCFDEWCVKLNSVSRATGGYNVEIERKNKGRRTQRPDTPRLFVISDGAVREIDATPLTGWIRPGVPARSRIFIPASPAAKENRLLIREGGWPSKVVIDDENSPGHAVSSWLLSQE